MQPEIQAYFDDVAKKYGIERQVTFNSIVESACWDESSGTWGVTIRNLKTLQVISRRSRVLVSAVGALSIPKSCDIPGASDFQGAMFHTAKWDHSFNWRGKEVVVIGKFAVRTRV
jgi:cation diffusion facilitator CzcD-associated flavoprotein CzcO